MTFIVCKPKVKVAAEVRSFGGNALENFNYVQQDTTFSFSSTRWRLTGTALQANDAASSSAFKPPSPYSAYLIVFWNPFAAIAGAILGLLTVVPPLLAWLWKRLGRSSRFRHRP